MSGTFVARLLTQRGVDVVVFDEGRSYPPWLVVTPFLPNMADVKMVLRSIEIYRSIGRIKVVKSINIVPRRIDLNRYVEAGVLVRELNEEEIRLIGLRPIAGDEQYVENLDYVVPIQGVLRVAKRGLKVIKRRVREVRKSGQWILVDGEKFDAAVIAAGHRNVELLPNLPFRPYLCYGFISLVKPRKLAELSIGDFVLDWYSTPMGFLSKLGLAFVGNGDSEVGEARSEEQVSADIAKKVAQRTGTRVRIVSTFKGLCESSPRGGPILGMVDENLYVIGGFDGYGAMMAPALSELLVRYVVGELGELPDEYRLDNYRNFRAWKLFELHKF